MQVIRLVLDLRPSARLLLILVITVKLVNLFLPRELMLKLYFNFNMCKFPISVPNPLFYKKGGYGFEFGKPVKLPSHFSSQEKFITVPCGKCVECRETYFNSIFQRALCESFSSYMYFVTLTYDDKHIPFVDLDDTRILYADYSHIQLMIKRLRNSCVLGREFRYLSVNEFGDKFSRPHFHLLFFVAKSEKDDEQTKYRIERLLYDNLKVFFSVNVGTRKNPQYEPLFTFAERVTPLGIRSNYFVKLVESFRDDVLSCQDESPFVRSIRYLINYVSTDIQISGFVSDFISSHFYDVELCSKLKKILSNRLRFSKGFGCGFVDLQKFYLPRISVRCSSNIVTYSELVRNLPSNLEDFISLCPDFYQQFLDWYSSDPYSQFDSLEECLRSFTVDDFYMHLLCVRYLGKDLSIHLKNLYGKEMIPSISLFFTVNRLYSYSLKPVVTEDVIENSVLYNFLRSGVEQGLYNRVPYFTFPLLSDKYMALCKYYRDRVCTFDDFQRLLDVCNVSSWDEWHDSFISSYRSYKSDKSQGQRFKNSENCEIILEKQKKSLFLRSRKSSDVYTTLFVL